MIVGITHGKSKPNFNEDIPNQGRENTINMVIVSSS